MNREFAVMRLPVSIFAHGTLRPEAKEANKLHDSPIQAANELFGLDFGRELSIFRTR
jgi:hypothetical protein